MAASPNDWSTCERAAMHSVYPIFRCKTFVDRSSRAVLRIPRTVCSMCRWQIAADASAVHWWIFQWPARTTRSPDGHRGSHCDIRYSPANRLCQFQPCRLSPIPVRVHRTRTPVEDRPPRRNRAPTTRFALAHRAPIATWPYAPNTLSCCVRWRRSPCRLASVRAQQCDRVAPRSHRMSDPVCCRYRCHCHVSTATIDGTRCPVIRDRSALPDIAAMLCRMAVWKMHPINTDGLGRGPVRDR